MDTSLIQIVERIRSEKIEKSNMVDEIKGKLIIIDDTQITRY